MKESKSYKRKKIAIHLHPRLGWLMSALIVGEQTFGHCEFIFVRGHSFQDVFNIRLRSYVDKYINVINKALGEGSTVSAAGVHELSFRDRVIGLLHVAKSITRNECASLKWAARDSLMRRRWAYIYFFSPRLGRRLLEYAQIRWSIWMRECNLRMLRRLDVDACILSHTTYSYYVAVIEASLSRGSPVLVVGDSPSALISRSRAIYHQRRFIKDSITHYENRFGSIETSRNDNSEHRSGFKPDNKTEMNQEVTALVIYSHCLKDCNYISERSQMLYENFFDWSLDTVWQLTVGYTEYDWVVFKAHPHASQYQDEWLIDVISRLPKAGRNRNKYIVLGKEEDLEKLLEEKKVTRSVAVSFSGTIAIERACDSKQTLLAGSSPAAGELVVEPRDLFEYRHMLRKKIPSNEWRKTDSRVGEEHNRKISQLSILGNIDKSQGKQEIQLLDSFFLLRYK